MEPERIHCLLVGHPLLWLAVSRCSYRSVKVPLRVS